MGGPVEESKGNVGGWSTCHGLGRRSELSPEGSEASPGAEGASAGHGVREARSLDHTGCSPGPRRGRCRTRGLSLNPPAAPASQGLPGRHGSRRLAWRWGPEEGRAQASPCPPAALQLCGIWHTAALASNNSALIRPGGHVRAFISTMSAKDGNLHGEILLPRAQGARGFGRGAGAGRTGPAPGRGRGRCSTGEASEV